LHSVGIITYLSPADAPSIACILWLWPPPRTPTD
jgi:hypothetical protein